ncbi:MAG: HlyC/CorC family transporter [Burkholderiales bacterium]|jgi:putative hemolysin|nr:HlyC/CorC family transporter [Burkholderiales bacterium]
MELILLAVLILLNAAFAMSEIAVVSSRKARLQRLVDDGMPGASAAIALHETPSNFLSTIQVGITSVGILSGAIGEAALADPLAAWIGQMPALAPYARGLALGAVVVGITYLSVVVGELVPKRLALLKPEVIAAFIARPMQWLARAARPLVWLLSASSDGLLRLVRARRGDEPPVTDEEIEVLMQQGAEAGVFHSSEQAIVANVLRLDEQRIGAIMTPRADIYTIDLDEPEATVRQQLAECQHHRVVVVRGGFEQVLGVLHVTDLLMPAFEGRPLEIERILRPPLYVPESVTTTKLMELFRKARAQFALIVDEYGEVQGLVTLTDVMASIVGDVPAEGVAIEQDAVLRDDGSWLIDGAVGIGRFRALLDLDPLPGEDEGAFNTLAGFALHQLGRIPAVGERFEAAGLRFEIVDMDRTRIDKLLVARLPEGA